MTTHYLLNKLRQENPLVHSITNQVVSNDVANSLLAIGASPMMAMAPEEMEEVTKFAKAVVLNIGTLTTEILEAMLIVGKAANKKGVPVILDPVGVGATQFRQEAVSMLLKEVTIQLITGNAGEMAYLAGIDWSSKGVDAGEGKASGREIAERVARRYQTVAAVSGKEDFVSDGRMTIGILNGDPMLTRVTGTGCMLSGICGAYLAVGGKPVLESTVEACTAYGVAAEIAVENKEVNGPGSFRASLIDALYNLSEQTIRDKENIKRYHVNKSEEGTNE
ncbi:hydroxyethylthiazole kinase [Alkalibacterium kapii]|uniref:Hydroxyethylthiazole kinase n=1 Tax=Alkalibacterium kapii TaxID=426704 RepID=A0A511ASL1_9LACT|nr:hydroxyethylthiazole kinase [Alkalibacterium kapii]GEK91188.1 hydroxyethylthiazole kinase [Alkalibacterium kapii]